MSNSQFLVAYSVAPDASMTDAELQIRVDVAGEYLRRLTASELEVVRVGDLRSGFIVWLHRSRSLRWPSASHRDGEGAAWLHVPAAAGGIHDGVDAITLARDVTDGSVDRAALGAPCAALYWNKDGLRIANDRFGMARLYEFNMSGFAHVWSSRTGLAHVFAGIEPEINQTAWSEMSTFGWPADGQAHMGAGHQLPPSSTRTTGNLGGVTNSSDLSDWIRASTDGDVPSFREGAEGMIHALRVASWWEQKPVADLSGGKDSRVTAAAAVRAGVVDALRTVETDPGEVETARELLRLCPEEIAHRIDAVSPPTLPEGGVMERYHSMHRAWEGAYNAVSAFRAHPFTGFKPERAARINGLGGEAIQGRNLVNAAIRERLLGKGPAAGQERLEKIAGMRSRAVTQDAMDVSRSTIRAHFERSLELGFDNAFMVIDHFYNFSKMPYWSHPQATGATLLPLYSPQLQARTMWAMRHPLEYGELHRELLRHLLPAWAEVPFYKGTSGTRSAPKMWEYEDWSEVSAIVQDEIETLETFDHGSVRDIVREASAGEGTAIHETTLTRVMWELSFRGVVDEVREEARRTARRVGELRAGA